MKSPWQDKTESRNNTCTLFSFSFFFLCSLSLPSHSSSSFSSVSPPSFLPFSHLFLSSLPSYLSYSPSFLLFWTCLPFCSTSVFSRGKSGLSFGDRQCSDFDKKWNVPADPRLKKFSCQPRLWKIDVRQIVWAHSITLMQVTRREPQRVRVEMAAHDRAHRAMPSRAQCGLHSLCICESVPTCQVDCYCNIRVGDK